ncbi:hypothetical protein ACFPH6_36110, partial [Streptomyces xiangluensis]
ITRSSQLDLMHTLLRAAANPRGRGLVLGLVVLVLALLGILAAAFGAAEHPAPGDQPVIRPG